MKPLNSNHFPPGTVIRYKDWPDKHYALVLSVGAFGITYVTSDLQACRYEDLVDNFQMWVPGGTGWQPCSTED